MHKFVQRRHERLLHVIDQIRPGFVPPCRIHAGSGVFGLVGSSPRRVPLEPVVILFVDQLNQ